MSSTHLATYKWVEETFGVIAVRPIGDKVKADAEASVIRAATSLMVVPFFSCAMSFSMRKHNKECVCSILSGGGMRKIKIAVEDER